MAAPAPAAPRGQEPLVHLLVDLYSWPELQVLARDLDPEGDLHTWIPGVAAPPRELAAGFLAGAEQRDLLGLPLFRAMMRTRPRRRRDIARVARDWAAWRRRPRTQLWSWVAWLNRVQLGGAAVVLVALGVLGTIGLGGRVEAARLDLLGLTTADIGPPGWLADVPRRVGVAAEALWIILGAMVPALFAVRLVRFAGLGSWVLLGTAVGAVWPRIPARVAFGIVLLLALATIPARALVLVPSAANPTPANTCRSGAGLLGSERMDACLWLRNDDEPHRRVLTGLNGWLTLAAGAWFVRAAFLPAGRMRHALLLIGGVDLVVLIGSALPAAAAFQSPGLSYPTIVLDATCRKALDVPRPEVCHAWEIDRTEDQTTIYRSAGCSEDPAATAPGAAHVAPDLCRATGVRTPVYAWRSEP